MNLTNEQRTAVKAIVDCLRSKNPQYTEEYYASIEPSLTIPGFFEYAYSLPGADSEAADSIEATYLASQDEKDLVAV